VCLFHEINLDLDGTYLDDINSMIGSAGQLEYMFSFI
jgi:hypothetical protein